MKLLGRTRSGSLMEILAVILALVAAFLVFKFIAGMVKFVVLGVILLVLFYFMTAGFGV